MYLCKKLLTYEKKSLLIYNTLEIDQSPRAPMEHSSRGPGHTVFSSPSARGAPQSLRTTPWLSWCLLKLCILIGKEKKTCPCVPAQKVEEPKRVTWIQQASLSQAFSVCCLHFSFLRSLHSGASGYDVAIHSGILIVQLKFDTDLRLLYVSLPICKMVMLFSHPGNKETLLGAPELFPALHLILAGLQIRNINQYFWCLKSSPVMLSLRTFPDYIRSSCFPAKHLK